MTTQDPIAPSPFHAGEHIAQTRTGKRDALEAFGVRGIRPYMPDQHRTFFEQLPFIVLGSVDDQGWPWASILTGGPGFMKSPDDRHLDLHAKPLPDDPLSDAIRKDAPIGVIGIEPATRRRNRMNANISTVDDGKIGLQVTQSFGNCPQYIQTRDITFVRNADEAIKRAPTDRFTTLDAAARSFISESNTFFVASYVTPTDNPIAQGVDVSHRGGRSGFVKVEGDTLTIPDYAGNYFFNTIGNFLVNPKAGLIFPDFATGDVLMLTGTVEILWENSADMAAFKGAERSWRFTLDHGIRIPDALPFRGEFGDYSPYSLMTDDWATSQARQQAEAQRNTWRPMQVTAIKDESSVIRSFTLDATDDVPLLSFEAGQFLTIRINRDDADPITRTYTVSSAPGDAGYRISVKREPNGTGSTLLHDTIKVGDIVDIKAPKGVFYIDPTEERPAVLFAGGVGVTPMMSMTRHVLNEGVRTRFTRPLTIYHAAKTTDERAFYADMRAAEATSGGKIRYISIIGKATETDREGIDLNAIGRITPDLIRQTLTYEDHDFYLCGPSTFMQAIYDQLRALGAPVARIFAESFGPSTLTRSTTSATNEAAMTVIKFETSGFEQRWEKGDGTLLETAEAHGLSPAFSCRSGSCGSCATRKLAGDVTYRTPVTATHADDEVLICCAVPADGTDTLILDL